MIKEEKLIEMINLLYKNFESAMIAIDMYNSIKEFGGNAKLTLNPSVTDSTFDLFLNNDTLKNVINELINECNNNINSIIIELREGYIKRIEG